MIRILKEPTKKIAFISSYLPRKCGIATFASDLIRNVKLAGGEGFEPCVFAMRSDEVTDYKKPVTFTIRKDNRSDYISAADYINYSDIDVVSVQHEFGLYGGDGGVHLSSLLKRLNKPVVTTLHTVLKEPTGEYFNSMIDVCEESDKIIVMNNRGIKMLQDIYGVPRRKIGLIPHGIPDLPFANGNYYKRILGISGRKIILTFGLLSKNKGIEVMLEALPTIIKADALVLYLIVGATHPEVLRHDGQVYRNKLEKMVVDLGLQNHVVFHNRFVEDEELLNFLGAADIYVTPYLSKQQLTSGTLAFAVGAGKAVVSTPYWAAQELLTQGRGRLVKFGDSKHIARAIVEILNNKLLFHSLRKRAYDYGRSITWKRIGQRYWDLFKEQKAPVAKYQEVKIGKRERNCRFGVCC